MSKRVLRQIVEVVRFIGNVMACYVVLAIAVSFMQYFDGMPSIGEDVVAGYVLLFASIVIATVSRLASREANPRE